LVPNERLFPCCSVPYTTPLGRRTPTDRTGKDLHVAFVLTGLAIGYVAMFATPSADRSNLRPLSGPRSSNKKPYEL